MKTFFQTLPKKLKVFFHAVELLLMLYVATAIALMGTPYGVHVARYMPVIVLSFLLIYPPVHLLAEFFKGVPGSSPDDADPLRDFKPKPPKLS